MARRHLLAAAASAAALLVAMPALAASVAYNAPNYTAVAGSTSVTMGGQTFVNQGLVGTARLPADLHDFNGETLGSFSGMAIDLATWRRAADGTYSAKMYTLPDRGPNNIGPFVTTDYAARLNRFTLSLKPYTGTAPVAASTQQMTLTQDGGFLFRDTTGALFTGRDPQAGTVTRNGVVYPTPPAGDPGAGKIALDAEAVAFLPDGSFYIGDEYGGGVLYFDAQGRQVGGIQANPDILPRVNGAINFNGTNDAPLVAGTTGRRSNQGMEGVSVSPDGTRLFAVLQSAALQDNPTNLAGRRNNTRVLVYDISANRTPGAPVAEYVLQLPIFNNSATGTGTPGTTAAQSEVLALNNSQFLVLSRDGNGRGTNGNANAIAYKSILLVDTAGATNIAGTPYAGTTPISTSANANGSGELVPGITPVAQVELVNMLNTTQLSKFGINTVTAPSTQYTLSEKWEAMGLAPVLEEDKPQDFFLLVGNDNDFVSADIDAAGVTNANAALNSPTAGVGNNDNVMMVYRLTIPTYIDPQALEWLRATAPLALGQARVAGIELGTTAATAAMDNVGALRRARYAGGEVSGVRGWGQIGYERVGSNVAAGDVDAQAITAGVDGGGETLRLGASIAMVKHNSDSQNGFELDGHSYGASLYGAVFSKSGVWAQGALSAARIKTDLERPASYGLIARGETAGHVLSASAELGYAMDLGGGRVGPYVGLAYSDLKLNAYTEAGAAVGNGAIPENKYTLMEATIGLEAAFTVAGVRPSVRVAYTTVDEGGDDVARLALAAVPGSAGDVALPTWGEDYASAQFAVEGDGAGFAWRGAVEVRDTPEETSGRVVIGLSKTF